VTASHFDLWLTAAQRVYRGVPYEVLADWLQQGRVAPNDRIRTAGKGDWQMVEDVPTLAVYLPRTMPVVPADRAEALAPVELDIAVQRRRADEDEDVDMIPLIDISLVLLIFFMMTTTVAVGGSGVDVPKTRFATLNADRTAFWVAVDFGATSEPVYSLGEGNTVASAGEDKLSLTELVDRIKSRLTKREAGQAVSVRIAANHRMPFETVRALTNELNKLRPLGLVEIKAEVAERAP
jgi:biopolymer transport protein ExbD